METDIKPRERVLRLCGRITSYFKSVIDPKASWPVRVKSLIKAGLATVAISALLLLAYTIVLIPFTPGIADLRKAKAETPSILMSEDGQELAVFKRMNREWVELDQISPHVINALIATEDHRFYEHHGVDLKRTAAGIVRTLQGRPEGGSTLTQQLARNLYPEEIGRKRSITRKLKELITALKIEYAYSKKEILLTYLNTMPFLYNAFGIEMGARTYFDKPAAKLDVLESATLIGMLKGTSYYNPVINPERALDRRNVVLSQMAKRGVLNKPEFDRLKKRPLRLEFERQPEPVGAAPHLAAYVRKWLIDWADRNDYNLYSDGLVVYSTVDSRMQRFAEQAASRQLNMLQAISNSSVAGRARSELLDTFVRESAAYRSTVDGGATPELALKQVKRDAAFMTKLFADKTRMETGFVAIDPTDGHVKAWIGSRDYEIDQYDHVVQAKRQPGSTFKPFVYGAALEQGMTPDKRYTDQEVEIAMGNGSVWRPTDASGPSGRQMTLREALAYSKNTITAQVMQDVGPKKVVNFARKLGVNQSTLDPVPALALGTSPVSLLEMVTAYSTIASGGEYRKPILVSHIADKDGKVLDRFSSDNKRVISAKLAYDLTDMLRGVINQGTGHAIKSRYGIRADVAGKTGTTQNNTDGWFILMHPRLVAGAWVGFNDARLTMRSNWGQGAQSALPVVGDFYRRTLNTKLVDSNARFATPPDSFFGSLMARLYEFFDWKKPQPEAPAPKPRTPSAAPAPEVAPPAPEIQADEMERIMNQAREAGLLQEGQPLPPEDRAPDPASPVDLGSGGTPRNMSSEKSVNEVGAGNRVAPQPTPQTSPQPTPQTTP